MLDLVFTGTFSYILALSPLGAMIVASLYKLYERLMEEPILAAVINTTVVAFEASKEVLKPIGSVALAVLQHVGTALVVVARYIKHLVLFVQNTTKALVAWFKANGADIGDVAKNFAHTTMVLTKALGTLLYYLAQGLNSIVTAFQESKEFLGNAYAHPETITWQYFQASIYSLTMSTAILALLTWWMFKSPRAVTAILVEPPMKPPRIQTRASRKRALLSSTS
jgi:hypothetical protein